MNSPKSRKMIVAGSMVVVVGIGLAIFALRIHSGSSVAQTPHPPTPFASPADAPAPAAETPAAPAAVAQVPGAPPAVAPSDSVSAKSADTATPAAVEPKLARSRPLAKASTSEKTAVETVANSETTTPATGSSPADDQKVGTSTGLAASDSQITTDVKSEIAGDSLSKDVKIGVTTTQGVVALTGSLASQGAIDHFKDVAGKVAGVKSVDTSALVLASL
jgi:hyperosmotically inducible protein